MSSNDWDPETKDEENGEQFPDFLINKLNSDNYDDNTIYIIICSLILFLVVAFVIIICLFIKKTRKENEKIKAMKEKKMEKSKRKARSTKSKRIDETTPARQIPSESSTNPARQEESSPKKTTKPSVDTMEKKPNRETETKLGVEENTQEMNDECFTPKLELSNREILRPDKNKIMDSFEPSYENARQDVVVICNYGNGWKSKNLPPADFTFSIESD